MSPFIAGLLASAVLWSVSMVLPGGHDEGPPRRGVAYLLLGGYFLVGLPLTAANLFVFWSWCGMALRRRRHVLWSSLFALALGTIGAVPSMMASRLLQYPAYWAWLLSIAIAVASAAALRRAS